MPFPIESIEQLHVFFWVLIRVSIIFFLLPLFGARGIPSLWKAGLSMVMAIILTPVVPVAQSYPIELPEIILALIAELLMGLFLAISIKMFFAVVQMGGHFMSS